MTTETMNASTEGVQTLGAEQSSRVASTLRWLGGLAVLCAGSVFMLQGFDNIGAQLRNWMVIVLMLSCAGAAYVTQRFFADAKGARLLFGLALLLVPVQYSQLGGMLHEVLQPAGASGSQALGLLNQWLPTLSSPGGLLMLLASTLIVGTLVTRAGFAVLVRELARPFTLYLSIFLAMLLIPARDSALGVVVLAAMAGGYLLALRQLDYRQALLRTFEGRSALVLLAMPLAIASGRFALHADSLGAVCAMVGLFGVLMVEVPRRLIGRHVVSTAMALVGLVVAAFAWMLYGFELWLQLPGYMAQTLVFLPIIAYWLESSRYLGSAGSLVRIIASIVQLMLALALLNEMALFASLILLSSSGVLLLWSIYRQYREPTLFAGTTLGLAVVQLLFLSLVDVHFNGWLLLAVSGVGLVVAASAVERHGKRLLAGSQSAWRTVRHWS